jgi:hypothetical protein
MIPFVTAFLLAHSICDMVISIAIWQHATCQQCGCLAMAYVGLWTDEADRSSFSSGVLLSMLVMHWSFMRTIAALAEWVDIAVWPFFMEGALVLFMVFIGRMRKRQGCLVVLLCATSSLVVMQGD